MKFVFKLKQAVQKRKDTSAQRATEAFLKTILQKHRFN